MTQRDCPFCELISNGLRPAESNSFAVALDDGFPVSPGHTLIASRRHVGRLRDLTAEERDAVWDLLPVVCARIEQEHAPDGYNIGLNDGVAAGQTVPHLHLHVIPR